MPAIRMLVTVFLGIAWPVLFFGPSLSSQADTACRAACASNGMAARLAVALGHEPSAYGGPLGASQTILPGSPSGSQGSQQPSPVAGSPRAMPSPSPLPSTPTSSASACPAPGAFPVAYFAPAFTGPASRVFQQQYITSFGSYVETCYPAGSSAPSSGVPGGAQAHLPLAFGTPDDATLSFQIRFPIGYTWVKGGKLPGLCGGQCWTGSSNGPGGWAGRFMWRSGGAGEVLLSDATTTGYGTDLGLGSWHFQADGRWHALSEHVHMNTLGQANGWIDVTYNGALVAHFTGITFRTDTATHIDSLIFSTFFGGHDSTWAPTTAQRIDFAAFQAG